MCITKEIYAYVYALLLGESQELYNELLDEVLNLFSDEITPNLASILTYFGKTVIKAFTAH